MKDSNNIQAIFEDDFVEFLQNIGAKKIIDNGEAKCKFCKRVLGIDDVATVFGEEGTIKFVCDDASCICQMNEYFNDK